jgi:hypothetical protein
MKLVKKCGNNAICFLTYFIMLKNAGSKLWNVLLKVFYIHWISFKLIQMLYWYIKKVVVQVKHNISRLN